MSSRKGRVYFKNIFAGTIEQKEGSYVYMYDESYLQRHNPSPISLTLPVRREPFESKTMPSFFDGLIPEGWLLDIAAKNWKLNTRDRMSLLLTLCGDCIGAVHIEAEVAPEDSQ